MEIQQYSGNFKLWSEMELHEFKDKFVIKAVESPDQCFSIGRTNGNIEPLNSDTSANRSKVSTIYGVAGTIRLLAGTYVLVITSRKEVGSHLGFPVFRVTSMKFLSCNEASLSNYQKSDEAYFRTLLKIVESTPGLYYSYETDITLNLQRRLKLAEGWMSKAIWKQADPRFVWNRNIMEELIENKLDGFIIPLLQGSFQAGQLKLKNSPATVTLISRRCTRRLGTRMWRRGANLEGETANFIETEQLLEFEGFRSSFLQIRGSIPLLWEQIVDLSYKPQLNIIDHEQQSKVVERHFRDILQKYGETVAVDLTDQHGGEGKLSMAFAAELEKLPNVRYISFNFHQYCGNSNLDNIHILYDQVSEDFEKQGYFLVDGEGKILAEQTGIIRSNCIDCLDRTNVTQSYLAQKSLNSQLQRLGVLSSTEFISMFNEEIEIFKTLWVDQGDEISLEYSGTHALKRDLVRYGKQTMAGIIKDGISAISRYYLNNFHDGLRQDAMDLISGRYNVHRNSPFQLNGFESFLGLSNRRTGATSINAESSRSHSVFTCAVKSRCKCGRWFNCFKTSRINLVDLAGSERQKQTGAAGERLKEAGNINRSLSQLGNLINILAEVSQSGKQRHIPYRDSRLTFLLQESLGGNAKLAMVCAISPVQSCKSETLSTLRFAQRAKAIKNRAVVNEVMQDDVNFLREVITAIEG